MGLCESAIPKEIRDTPKKISEHYFTAGLQDNLNTIPEESPTIERTISCTHTSQFSLVLPHSGKTVTNGNQFYLFSRTHDRTLHSHKIRLAEHQRMNEVTACDHKDLTYDVWELVVPHSNGIQTGSIVLIRHQLTDTYLSCLQNGVIGTVELTNQYDSSCLWVLQFMNELLEDSCTLRIKHKTHKLFLTRTHERAKKETHRKVKGLSQNTQQGHWTIKLI